MDQDKNITDDRAPAGGLSGADRELSAAWNAAGNSANTIRSYLGSWTRWQEWTSDRGVPAMPADPDDISAYLIERAESGMAPATVLMDRAGIAAVHRIRGAQDPTACEAVRQAVRFIVRRHHEKGRGQVQGVDWAGADRAAALAADDGSVAGLRDGALIRVASDALLRVSEVAGLDIADLHVRPNGTGDITIRRSNTDQEAVGVARYLGAPTVAAVQRYLAAAGVTSGPLFRRVNKGGAVGGPLGVRSIRRIITSRVAAAGIGGRVSGHSLRVGAAQELAAAGAGVVDLQDAGGWKSPRMPAHYARHQHAERSAVERLRYPKEQ